MRRARGFTLIEMLTASAILLVVVGAATNMLIAATRLVANDELAVEASDNARLALEELASNLRRAGMGASQGIWVNKGGAPFKINAVFGLDGTTGAGGSPATPTTNGADDLWMVVSSRNAFRQVCVDPGAGTTVVSAGLGPLAVTCVSGLTVGQPLLATNLNSAALLTGTTFTGNTINYAESGLSQFSDNPEKGGFMVGDMVVQAQVLHYFIQNDARGIPGLYKALGKIQVDTVGRPFVDDNIVGATLVVPNVEDLQVAFGVDTQGLGDPESYAFQAGLAPDFVANVRSVRVSVVGLSGRAARQTNSTTLKVAPFLPMTVENHTPAASTDGRRRGLFTRRLELVNQGVASL